MPDALGQPDCTSPRLPMVWGVFCWRYTILCLLLPGEMGLFAPLVADRREWSLQRAMGQPSYGATCPLEVLFPSCRESYGDDGANLGFSNWPGTWGQSGWPGWGSRARGSWSLFLVSLFPIPQPLLLALLILPASSLSPPSTSSPVANPSLTSPPCPQLLEETCQHFAGWDERSSGAAGSGLIPTRDGDGGYRQAGTRCWPFAFCY